MAQIKNRKQTPIVVPEAPSSAWVEIGLYSRKKKALYPKKNRLTGTPLSLPAVDSK